MRVCGAIRPQGLHFILNEPYQLDQQKQAPILAERGMVAFTTRDWTTHNPAGTLAQLIAPVSEQTLLRALWSALIYSV